MSGCTEHILASSLCDVQSLNASLTDAWVDGPFFFITGHNLLYPLLPAFFDRYPPWTQQDLLHL